jgi:REP element-mobilizing transposase RayT
VIKFLGERSSRCVDSKRIDEVSNTLLSNFTKTFGTPDQWHTGNLPNRNKPGLVQSITFRLADSLPKEVLAELDEELENLPEDQQNLERRKKIQYHLDQGAGCCALAHPEMANTMLDALKHHDGDRYELLAWSIMPNHVHVLILTDGSLAKIVQSWKSFTGKWAMKHNRKLKLGVPSVAKQFWQNEYWDRFILSEEHFKNAVLYILDNPDKAGLGVGSTAALYTGHGLRDRMKRELHPSQSKMVMTRGKDKGLVVDYFGIKSAMNQALAMYSKTDATNFEDVQLSITEVRNHLDLLGQLFHTFDSTAYFTGDSVAQLDCLNHASEFAQLTDKIEHRFMQLVKRLKAAYDVCCGAEDITEPARDKIHFYPEVRSIIAKLNKGDAPDTAQMNAKVREMIGEAIKSDGVEEIFKLGDEQASEIDIFDEDYLTKISNIKLPKTKAKLLQQMPKKAIAELKKVNKMKGVDFSKKFNQVVDKYNERKEGEAWTADGIDDLTEEMLIMALAKNGYPPVDRDEVYKEVFEQAENFKKYKG